MATWFMTEIVHFSGEKNRLFNKYWCDREIKCHLLSTANLRKQHPLAFSQRLSVTFNVTVKFEDLS